MSAAYLVLTAAAGVPEEAVTALRSSRPDLALGAPRRLAPTAVEIPVDAADAVPSLAGLDVNLVPAAARRAGLFIADMDSTIIPVECIDELADFAGARDEVAAITERAMRGELDFEAALRARVARLADLPVATLEACYRERIGLTAGAETLLATLKARGVRTALVSGGFTFFVDRVAARLGFDEARANVLAVADDRLSGDVVEPILGQDAKLAALQELRGEGAAIAIGDGANDLGMIRAADLGIAWRAKPVVAGEADARLQHSDLTAVLALLGLAEADWQRA
ncbi:MAG: phosphoserine phosphatase SerB [Pseudomonadota bacterium]